MLATYSAVTNGYRRLAVVVEVIVFDEYITTLLSRANVSDFARHTFADFS